MASAPRRSQTATPWAISGAETGSASEALLQNTSARSTHSANAAGAASVPALSFGARSGLVQLSGVHLSGNESSLRDRDLSEPSIQASRLHTATHVTQQRRAGPLSDAQQHNRWLAVDDVSSERSTDEEVMPAIADVHTAKPSAENPSQNKFMGALYGLIASVCSIPSMTAYSTITFSHERFAERLPLLVRVTLLSACVHQVALLLGSRMRFIIGQVQDAGLVYLAAICSDVVERIDGASPGTSISDEALATSLVAVSAATAITGVALIVIGKLRLARFVQYLPLPVLAGFLSFIGVYLLESSVSLVCGFKIESVTVQLPHVSFLHALALLAPAVAGFLLLAFVTRTFDHPAALPLCIFAIPVLFYLILLLIGGSDFQSTLAKAREYGFLDQPEDKPVSPLDVLRMFRLDLVQWNVLPQEAVSVIGLIVCVAAGSLLDVAAIEASINEKLDYNVELATIGISNLCSGVLGGQTGSYLFGQSILVMNSGFHTRITGIVVVFTELIAAGLPFSLLAFAPKALFGSVLGFIGFSIFYDWMLETRKLLPRTEYVLLLVTFFGCHTLGIQGGLLTGLLACGGVFVYITATKQSAAVVSANSTKGATRNYVQRAALASMRDRLLKIDLVQYLFFGSASQLASWIEERSVYCDVVVMNFAQCSGIDASAARALAALARNLAARRIRLLFAHASQVQNLLEAHGVVRSVHDICEVSSVALKIAEDILLQKQGYALASEDVSSDGAIQSLASHLGPNDGAGLLELNESNREALERLFREEEQPEGKILFSRNDWPDALYLVASGEIAVRFEDDLLLQSEKAANSGAVVATAEEERRKEKAYYITSGPIGISDFLLRAPYSYKAVVESETAVLYVLPLKEYEALQQQPEIHAALAEALAKCLALEHSADSTLQRAMQPQWHYPENYSSI